MHCTARYSILNVFDKYAPEWHIIHNLRRKTGGTET
ncbi:hypothetical protein BH11PAT2_BH11PAT2_01240 [soil metagenome]